MITLDLIQTVALAGVLLFVGYGIRKFVPILARVNIPAPVCGGLPVAALLAALHVYDITPLRFDTTLQTPLQNAFFASVGFGASVALLLRGGVLVMFFFVLSTIAAVLQNVVGGGVAMALGENPLLGVLAGSVTLTGGPATGLAFAPFFEEAGVPGAATLAVAAAMVGIVSGGIIGAPIATYLIERGGHTPSPRGLAIAGTMQNVAERRFLESVTEIPAGEDVEAFILLKHLVIMLAAMAVGLWISNWLTAWLKQYQMTLPVYIGAMLVAAALRNLDDATRVIGLSQRVIDDIGNVALSLFLVMALMTLRLWEIAGLVLPLLIIVATQVLLVAVLCLFIVPRLMGRDYDAAVISAGFCGFMLGTTANAMANMGALVERYGPSPKAYFVVPLVGAFAIDFTNAILITFFLNLWR